jgi:hypothetical protein
LYFLPIGTKPVSRKSLPRTGILEPSCFLVEVGLGLEMVRRTLTGEGFVTTGFSGAAGLSFLTGFALGVGGLFWLFEDEAGS